MEEKQKEENEIRDIFKIKIEKNSKILKIRFIPLTYHQVDVLCDLIAENKTLQYLDLTGSNLQNEGTTRLCQSLLKNKAISFLNLSLNKIGDEGITCICSMLENALNINHLDISCNEFTEKGLTMIKDMIKKNVSSLETLSIRMNKIEESGVSVMLSILSMTQNEESSLKNLLI